MLEQAELLETLRVSEKPLGSGLSRIEERDGTMAQSLEERTHGFPWSGRIWQVFPIHAICSQDLRAATSGRFPVKSGAEAHIWGFPCRWCHQEYLAIWRSQKATSEIGVTGLRDSRLFPVNLL